MLSQNNGTSRHLRAYPTYGYVGWSTICPLFWVSLICIDTYLVYILDIDLHTHSICKYTKKHILFVYIPGSSQCEEFYAFSPLKKELLYLEKDRWRNTHVLFCFKPLFGSGDRHLLSPHCTKTNVFVHTCPRSSRYSCPLPRPVSLCQPTHVLEWNVEKWHLCYHMFPCKTMGLETRPMNG